MLPLTPKCSGPITISLAIAKLDEKQQAEFMHKAKELVPKYRTERLKEAFKGI